MKSTGAVLPNIIIPSSRWLALAGSVAVLAFLSLIVPLYWLLAVMATIVFSLLFLSNIKYALYPLFFLVATCTMFYIGIIASWPRNDALYLFQLFAVYLLFLWLICRATNITPRRDRTPLDMVLLMLVIWAGISLIWARNFNHSLFQLGQLISNLLVFYLVGALIQDEATLKKTAKFMLIMGVIFGISGIFSLLTSCELDTTWLWDKLAFTFNFEAIGHRARGFAIHNLAGSWYNFLLAIAWVLFIFPEKNFISRRKLILSITIMEVGLLATKSRAGITSHLVMIIFLILMSAAVKKQKLLRQSAKFLVFFTVCMFLATIRNPFGIIERFGVSFSGKVDAGLTMTKRFEYWESGAKALLNKGYGILGLGIGGFKEYVLPIPHAHSFYFSMLFDFGYIGFLLLSLFLVLLISQMLKYPQLKEGFTKKMYLAFCAGMIAFSLGSLIDFYYNSPHIWFFWGWGMAILRLASTQKTA